MDRYRQERLFPEEDNKPAVKPEAMQAPASVMWNPWHGCTKISAGCRSCYVYRRDAEYGKDASVVHQTKGFRLPVQKYRSGPDKGGYKHVPGTTFFTCFTSDFFHEAADGWRREAWEMIKERSDCSFYMVTKRPERIRESLPADWGCGYDNVEISCTCENQSMADRRLPLFLELPLPHRSIIHEPMLGRIDIRPYLWKYGATIESVTCGGESGPEARICDYAWILDTHMQCVEYSVPFHFHQTGARLRRGNRIYDIPRERQMEQARKAGLDFDGRILPDWQIP